MINFFMFRCTEPTYSDCINLNLFGQQESQANDVLQVRKGDILFLNKVGGQIILLIILLKVPFMLIQTGV